jgi:hypothetical protein
VLLALSLNTPNVPNFITKFKQSQIFCPGLKGFLWKNHPQPLDDEQKSKKSLFFILQYMSWICGENHPKPLSI